MIKASLCAAVAVVSFNVAEQRMDKRNAVRDFELNRLLPSYNTETLSDLTYSRAYDRADNYAKRVESTETLLGLLGFVLAGTLGANAVRYASRGDEKTPKQVEGKEE